MDSPEFFLVPPGLVAFVAGFGLIAVALFRGRTVPRWLPVLVAIGVLGSAALPPGNPAAIVASLVLIAAFALLPVGVVRQLVAESVRR